MGRSGSELLLEALEVEEVSLLFGYPGGVLISLYDALLDSRVKHILVRHEQGAVHAADAYSRVSGKVGVCLATSGPGATNLVTGIANAYMDSVPMVILTGQVPTDLLGTDSFQEVDITGVTMPITKHSYLVKDGRDIPRVVKEAFYIARTGRPGPVLIDLPKDVLAQVVEPKPAVLNLKSYKFFNKGNAGQIEEAARAIRGSKKPVLYAGGGVIKAEAEQILQEIVEKANLPVVTTLMGIGSLPSDHPNLLGMVGMHGTVAANYAVDDCDLLIAVGVRFDDRVTSGLQHQFATNAKVIHIDIDPAEIGKVIRPQIPIVGNAKSVLGDLLLKVSPPQADEWWKKLREWQKKYPLSYLKDGRLRAQMVIETLGELTNENTIIVTDVGQHQMWTAQFYPFCQSRQLVTSGGLGTMGFGLPAAIGAQFAYPDRQVLLISGDGSLQMTVQEMATIVQHKLPIKIALMNNGVLGMVRQMQKLFLDERYSQIQLHANPDFVKLAEAYSIKGIGIKSCDEVENAVRTALADPGPVLMDFQVSADEDVLPMVPAGKAITEMLGR